MQLTPAQNRVISSKATEVFFVAGLGAGKTFTAAQWLSLLFHPAYKNAGLVFGLFAPVYEIAQKVTLRAVVDVWNEYAGLSQGVHYVVGCRPPEAWRVKPFSPADSNNILTTITGNYLYVNGLHEFDKALRGREFDRVFVDEWRDCKPGARPVLLGRMRGRYFTAKGYKRQILYATTPPNNPSELLKIAAKSDGENIEYITSTSFENPHLDAQYIQAQKNILSDLMYRREVLGELISIADKLFASSFDQFKHTGPVEYDENEWIYLSFDFNVDPMTCIAGQITNDGVCSIIKEFRVSNATIHTLLSKITTEFPDAYFVVTGDSSGHNRNHASIHTLFSMITRGLNLGSGQLRTPKANIPHVDSYIHFNGFLEHYPNFQINPETCPYLIEDLKTVQMDASGQKIDKTDLQKGHLLDCLRYFIYTYLRRYDTV